MEKYNLHVMNHLINIRSQIKRIQFLFKSMFRFIICNGSVLNKSSCCDHQPSPLNHSGQHKDIDCDEEAHNYI